MPRFLRGKWKCPVFEKNIMGTLVMQVFEVTSDKFYVESLYLSNKKILPPLPPPPPDIGSDSIDCGGGGCMRITATNNNNLQCVCVCAAKVK
jgi:hypothetical protein